MYPELFHIGNFTVHTYGVLLALALITSLFVAARLAKRDGLPHERIYDLGLWILIAGLLGSKILLFIVDGDYTDPMKLFSFDFLRSGGVFYGGFLGGLLAAWFLIKFYKLNFWKVADSFAPAVAIGQAIGRQGCFAAGCCYGKVTDSIFGVHFTEKAHELTGVPIYDETGGILHLHPTQLYESIAMFAVFGLLYYLHGRKKFDGQIIILYAILYPIFRFINEFFRADSRGSLLGINDALSISTSQLISLLVAITAIVFLIIRLRQTAKINK